MHCLHLSYFKSLYIYFYENTACIFQYKKKVFQECREISNLNSEKVHCNYDCIAVISAFSVFLK